MLRSELKAIIQEEILRERDNMTMSQIKKIMDIEASTIAWAKSDVKKMDPELAKEIIRRSQATYDAMQNLMDLMRMGK